MGNSRVVWTRRLAVMAGVLGSSYSVASPSGQCAATGAVIPPGDAYIAVLAEHPGRDDLERVDYSVGAWGNGARPTAPAVVFASWRAVMPEPNQKTAPLIDRAAAVDLFEQLGESDERRRVACRFVLALILIRKRVLRHVGPGRDRDGRAVMLVRWTGEARANDPEVRVIDPGLCEDDVEEVCRLLGEVADGSAGGVA